MPVAKLPTKEQFFEPVVLFWSNSLATDFFLAFQKLVTISRNENLQGRLSCSVARLLGGRELEVKFGSEETLVPNYKRRSWLPSLPTLPLLSFFLHHHRDGRDPPCHRQVLCFTAGPRVVLQREADGIAVQCVLRRGSCEVRTVQTQGRESTHWHVQVWPMGGVTAVCPTGG